MALDDDNNPLGPEHRACLDRVLMRAVKVMKIVQACENCGLDVSQAREEIEQQRKMAEALKREFFPECS